MFVVSGVCMRSKIEIDPDWLREKYLDEWLSAKEISELVDASPKTIIRRLKENDIDIRSSGGKKKPLSKEKLQREYIDAGMSPRDIANGEDYSRNHVQRSLEYHDMEIRSQVEGIWKHHGEVCSYRTHPRGHVIIGSGADRVYVHQLIAIAEGAAPAELFGGGSVVHHRNSIPWDNRPENLEVFDDQGEHMREHGLPGWQTRR